MSVINLATARQDREAALWQAYVTAKSRADETLALDDGRAAGKAWRAFLEFYQSAEQSAAMRQCDAVVASWGRRG